MIYRNDTGLHFGIDVSFRDFVSPITAQIMDFSSMENPCSPHDLSNMHVGIFRPAGSIELCTMEIDSWCQIIRQYNVLTECGNYLCEQIKRMNGLCVLESDQFKSVWELKNETYRVANRDSLFSRFYIESNCISSLTGFKLTHTWQHFS